MEKIIEEIQNLSYENKKEIFLLIKKYDIPYTENSNGILIDVNKINRECLDEINKYITFIKENKNIISNFEISKKDSIKKLNNTI